LRAAVLSGEYPFKSGGPTRRESASRRKVQVRRQIGGRLRHPILSLIVHFCGNCILAVIVSPDREGIRNWQYCKPSLSCNVLKILFAIDQKLGPPHRAVNLDVVMDWNQNFGL
jgi:hypothetical protein